MVGEMSAQDSLAASLGEFVVLELQRFAAPGAYLADPDVDPSSEREVVLLPTREVPKDAKAGDELEVFLYRDASERLVATTREVKLTLGQVAFLAVTAVTDVGAFVDWGLGKELLVPYAEQTRELRVGERHPFALYLDKSGRLAATMRVAEYLQEPPQDIRYDQWVFGEAWRNDEALGLFVILDKQYVGLLPLSEPHRLRRGERARFRIAKILQDGKVVLSLRQLAHEEIARDAENILAALQGDRPPRLGDRSDPDLIRQRFGLSKKAFKRAVGRLLVQGQVEIDDEGIVSAKDS